MTVYLDVLFLLQWFIHLLILISTAKLSGRKMIIGRMLAGSAIGALYSILFLFPQLDFICSLSFKLIFSMVDISIAFTYRHIKQWARTLLCFYLCSFMLGGCVYASMFLTGVGPMLNAVSVNGVIYLNLPWQFLISAMIVCLGVISGLSETIQKSYKKNSLYCDLHIEFEGKEKTVTALLDSGNLLRDPLTNAMVIMVDYRSIKSILSDGFNDEIHQWNTKGHKEQAFSHEWKIRIIPFRSVGTENGMLLGFVPDKVTIKTKKENILCEKCVIAFAEEALSLDGSFQAIIDAECVLER